MREWDMDASVAALVEAHRTGVLIEALPRTPSGPDEAHAIQDEVIARLGVEVGGFKASIPKDAPPKRALIQAPMIRQSPAHMTPEEAPHRGVEAEIVFRFTRDFPPRPEPYAREEIAAGVSALPGIEVVSSRFREPLARPPLEQMADAIINGGLVLGPETADWSGLDLARLHVRLEVNGETLVDRQGGHPTNDPLGIAVALVEMMRTGAGVRTGQVVATGSWSGMPFLKPGDHCVATFEGLGTAEVTFSA
ncbi:2-keto-4-pentenoate hydratase [Azorhizobium oxalatiphilum]|uniref:2-keto-4-pentenoate hydratase n=1 Tax=Azorhizobium oxalatiphilum TaxID=980631 RepID=A0A917BYC3_9HYPH|nr:fumarylacetoacetate hydrolase family protein [Azorhizobium oxalatiphilum]GGF62854.1 2-keto-4-pentenoate hydratase [Azorhizobium oxalatiphilum]